MENRKKEQDAETTGKRLTYNRREAMRALVKYSATVGGAAAIVVTAEGVVSAASAYQCNDHNQASINCN